MKFLSHRGYWNYDYEKNTAIAFERSFSLGFGTETDLRDLNGEVVISHDMPSVGVLTFSEMLEIYCKYDKPLPLALNIKSDGLQKKVKSKLLEYGVENYFLFDMSIPDHLVSLKHGLKCFTRHSEYENYPLYEDSIGVWIDAFKGDWIDDTAVQFHLNNDKKVCIVSPDLHKRKHENVWAVYKHSDKIMENESVMLCTDFPEDAKYFFDAK